MPQVVVEQHVVRATLLSQLVEVDVAQPSPPPAIKFSHALALFRRVGGVISSRHRRLVRGELFDDWSELAVRLSDARSEDRNRRHRIGRSDDRRRLRGGKWRRHLRDAEMRRHEQHRRRSCRARQDRSEGRTGAHGCFLDVIGSRSPRFYHVARAADRTAPGILACANAATK